LILTLIIEQPNIMRVFEFRETLEPMIVMAYYPDGNLVDAGVVDDERCISALGQILDGLSHLHAKGVVHRDLKPENLLVEKKPFFKVVITDFGLAKVATNTTLLTTFCGTLKYLAPEVFPGLSDGHGPLVDVWSLGVIVLEWIYGIPTPPTIPTPKKNEAKVPPKKWYLWIETWSQRLLDKLDDQDDGQVVEILLRMIEVEVRKRWHANRCLAQGFKNGLFKRRVTDDLVVCAKDPDDHGLSIEGNDGTRTPTAASSPQQTRAGIDPKATIIQRNLWGGEGSANSLSASTEDSHPGPPTTA
jgi:serine/threonine protein kinase